MKTILLMDDTSTDTGHMANGCQRKLEKHGFKCVFESGKDPTSGAILNTVESLGTRLVEVANEISADGVVLDLVWGNFDWNSLEVLDWAIANGLTISKEFAVFLTQHRSAGQIEQHAQEHDLNTRQLLFKNAQGNEAAVDWFHRRFGDECPCKMNQD